VRTPRPLLLLALLLGALALAALAGCGDSDDGGDETTQEQASTTAAEAAGACEPVDLPAPKADARMRKPTERLDPGRDWVATVRTNCGDFSIKLDVARAPKTTASFASLARRGFYDDLTFHRIAPGFVIQGGDPLGDGTGGPGYSVVEAPPRDLQYTLGVVAMAKTATEPDGASGSQFFVVLGDAGLPPQYALVGTVQDGLDVVEQIGALPIDSADPQGSTPLEPVVIESVEISNG
jgi:peptidyl-prolyl cis-trans isomerase B (cyclophilin B)